MLRRTHERPRPGDGTVSDKHAATYHDGNAYECACGDTHRSLLATLYCAEQMETEGRQARREPKVKKPSNIVRSVD